MVVCTMREKWKHLPTQKQKQMCSPGNHNKQNRVLFIFLPYFFFFFVTFSRDKWPHRSSYGAPSLPALVLLFLFVLFRTATPASGREGERRSPGHSHTRRHTEKPLTRTAAVLKGTPDMRQNATVSREPSKLNKKKQK